MINGQTSFDVPEQQLSVQPCDWCRRPTTDQRLVEKARGPKKMDRYVPCCPDCNARLDRHLAEDARQHAALAEFYKPRKPPPRLTKKEREERDRKAMNAMLQGTE